MDQDDDVLSEENKAEELVVAGRYVVSTTIKAGTLAGCPAFAARDRLSGSGKVLALAPPANAPVSASFQKISLTHSPALLSFDAIDDSSGALWVITTVSDSFRPLSEFNRTWSEQAVREKVLRPFAAVLKALQLVGETHRGIRPDNVFFSENENRFMLGPGCLSSPARYQPSIFESLSSALCPPVGRGGGSIADDVFSLGVLAVYLLSGRLPAELTSASEETVLQKRLAEGSPEVLMPELQISPQMSSMIAAMLSDEASARPSPSDIADHSIGKIFRPRRPHVALNPLMLGDIPIRNIFMLLWHGMRNQAAFSDLIIRGVVERWIASELGLATEARIIGATARQLESVRLTSLSERQFLDIIRLLAPDFPFFWKGLWFWPDALSSLALAMTFHEINEYDTAIRSALYSSDIAGLADTGDDEDFSRISRRAYRLAGDNGQNNDDGICAFIYLSNPLQPCLSSEVTKERFSSVDGLMTWLNAGEQRHHGQETMGFLDRKQVIFMLCRSVEKGFWQAENISRIAGKGSWLTDLRFVAILQRVMNCGPLCGVAHKFLSHLDDELKRWKNMHVRSQKIEQLTKAARDGDLSAMSAVLADTDGFATDRSAFLNACEEIALLEHELISLEHTSGFYVTFREADIEQMTTAFGAMLAVISICVEALL